MGWVQMEQARDDGGGGNFAEMVARTAKDLSDTTVTAVAPYVFQNYSALETINFPNCSTVYSSAFQNCSSLKRVDMENLKVVQNSVFSGCYSMSVFNAPNITSIGSSAFTNCRLLANADFPNLTFLGSLAFTGCTSLSTAILPKVSVVYSGAFTNCTNLTTVELSKCSVVQQYAFSNCRELTSISLPSCINMGQSGVFYGALKLSKLNLPKCTIFAGNNANAGFRYITIGGSTVQFNYTYTFRGNTSLETLVLPNLMAVPSFTTNMFSSTPMLDSSYLGYFGSIFVSSAMLSKLRVATGWSSIASRIASLADINNPRT